MDEIKSRFEKYVEKTDGCWRWLGFVNHGGYGTFRLGKSNPNAHRVSYMIYVDKSIDGFVIDHLCHNKDEYCKQAKNCSHRSCVNPAHLEKVTQQENLLRGKTRASENSKKQHCPVCGGQYRPRLSTGSRFCHECKIAKQRVRRSLAHAS